MPDQPTYPKDASVGAGAAKPAGNSQEEAAGGGAGSEVRRRKYVKAGVAVGIGSAAIVAALLYANKGKRSDKDGD